MPLFGSKLVVALDASSVMGALVFSGVSGPRLRSLARAPLDPGALVLSPVEGGLARPEEVREALAVVRRELGTNGRRACLVLPDGLARVLLLEVPEGAVPNAYARFRLSQGLPYPADEALVDLLPLGGRSFLGAAVRRGVVEAVETAAAGAGFVHERIDVGPLAAMAILARRPLEVPSAVDIILGETAVSLAAFRGGVPRLFRSRLRDRGPDEPRRLLDEVDRTASLAGDGPPERLRVVGPGAGGLMQELAALGRRAEAGWRAPSGVRAMEAAELAWLGAALG